MRILHTADWHLGRRLKGRNRHDEQVAALEEICRVVEEERIDVVVIAGDVFDSYNPPAESEALYYETVVRLSDGGRRGVVVIAGNHDSPERLTASDPYGRALGVVAVGRPIDAPMAFDRGQGRCACSDGAPSFLRLRLARGSSLALIALPYPSESRMRTLWNDMLDEESSTTYDSRIREFMAATARNVREGERCIVVSHLFVAGGSESGTEKAIQQIGGAYAVDARSFPACAQYVALGHLHRPQRLEGIDGQPVRYSGSLLQCDFSEAGQQKLVHVIEIGENGSAEVSDIPLSSGRKLIRRDDLRSLDELERFLNEVEKEAWIAFSVTLDEPPDAEYLARLRAANPNVLDRTFAIHRADSEEPAISLRTLSLEEQFRRFVRLRHDVQPTEDVVKLFLELASSNEV